MIGIGFTKGGDFVDKIFNNYKNKVMATQTPKRELKDLMSQVDINSTDFWRNIKAQQNMAGIALDKARTYYGNVGEMEKINAFGTEVDAGIFGRNLETAFDVGGNIWQGRQQKRYSDQMAAAQQEQARGDFLDRLNYGG